MKLQLVLASSSPRRKALLLQIGLRFSSYAPEIDESQVEKRFSSPAKLAVHLALEKAKKAQQQHPRALILAADTVVSVEGKILGKPASPDEALRMLLLLNGKKHLVTTGVAAAFRKKVLARAATTTVWFFRRSRDFLKGYVRTGEPLDKAGAYGIQGGGALLVRKIDGDYSNVVGLPLADAVELLEKVNPAVNGLIFR